MKDVQFKSEIFIKMVVGLWLFCNAQYRKDHYKLSEKAKQINKEF